MGGKSEGEQTLSVSRKEVKYLLSLPDRLYLLDALDRLLTPDAYGGYNGYTVRSVYFDSMCKFCSNGTPILKSSVHSF